MTACRARCPHGERCTIQREAHQISMAGKVHAGNGHEWVKKQYGNLCDTDSSSGAQR